MIMRVSSVLVALALFGFAAGCSEAPVAKFDAGKSAIESARANEVELYASETFKQATDSLNAAAVEMQNQDSKFSLLRSYGRAEELIAAAERLTQQAEAEAVTEKEKTRVADSILIAELELLLAETKTALASAPKAKGTAADLKVLQGDIEAASNALAVAAADYNSGQYMAAKAKLDAIKPQVEGVKAQVEEAIKRITKK
ncbi:MAG: hypothetical protein AB1483_02215 [Candidatus Zixiibacteriota bacterium]